MPLKFYYKHNIYFEGKTSLNRTERIVDNIFYVRQVTFSLLKSFLQNIWQKIFFCNNILLLKNKVCKD